jgi:hypothetical protein
MASRSFVLYIHANRGRGGQISRDGRRGTVRWPFIYVPANYDRGGIPDDSLKQLIVFVVYACALLVKSSIWPWHKCQIR